MKKNLLTKALSLFIALTAATAALAQDSTETKRPLPGAEFETGAAKRVTKKVPITDLAEGSPEWVLCKAMQARIDQNYDEEKKYVSPSTLWNHRGESPSWLNEYKALVSFTDVIYLGDSGSDENSAYLFAGFPKRSNGKRDSANYWFFLKEDGKWVLVSQMEWQDGKMRPEPTKFEQDFILQHRQP